MSTEVKVKVLCNCIAKKATDVIISHYVNHPDKFVFTDKLRATIQNLLIKNTENESLLIEMIEQHKAVFSYCKCNTPAEDCIIYHLFCYDDQFDVDKFMNTFVYRINNEILMR